MVSSVMNRVSAGDGGATVLAVLVALVVAMKGASMLRVAAGRRHHVRRRPRHGPHW